jgi:hypothetical protein
MILKRYLIISDTTSQILYNLQRPKDKDKSKQEELKLMKI